MARSSRWLTMISDLCEDCKFHPPLSEEWIDKGLAELKVTLNDSLKSFLCETDGLYDYHRFLWMVWNVRDLLAYNHEMRNHVEFANRGYTFEDIFFISNRGEGGILYGFRIVNNIMQEEIVAWYPKTNERIPKANNLEAYLEKWINDKDQL